MNAESIAAALGDTQNKGRGWWHARCPVCGHSKLALHDADDGLIARCFHGCAGREVYETLRSHKLIGRRARRPTAVPLSPDELAARAAKEAIERQRRIDFARQIWSETVLASDTVVETYLWSRLLMVPVPNVIRLHRSFWHSEGRERRPAMIARVDHIQYGSIGVHATWLQPDGAVKASLTPPRKTFGPIGGGAVQLGDIRPGEWLIVGEGLETVLSAMMALDLPGWAALSNIGIENLVLPREAAMIIVAGDNDTSGAGQLSADKAARRFLAEGRRVKVWIPPKANTDWNDVLRGRAPARAGVDHAA